MKKILAIALAACMALTLVACGGLDVTKLTMPTELNLEAGQTSKLEITYDGEATAEDIAKALEKAAVTWKSSDEAVATVGTDGTVTAVAAGEADVTATSQDGKTTLTCKVTVTEPVVPETEEEEGTKLAMDSDGMDAVQAMKDEGIEFPENIDQETVVWSSSNPAVATVDANGHITPVGVGECVITVNASLLDAAASNMSAGNSGGIVFLSAAPAPSAMTLADANTWSAELHIVVCEHLDEVTTDTDTDTETKDTEKDSEEKTDVKKPAATSTPTTDSGNKNGSTATGGETVSGGNDKTPDPTPAPAPNPTPAPDTGNNDGNLVTGGGNINDIIPGAPEKNPDGTWEGDGGNAETIERPDPAPAPDPVPDPVPPADNGNLVTGGGNINDIIQGAPEQNPDGTWEGDGGNAETIERPAPAAE